MYKLYRRSSLLSFLEGLLIYRELIFSLVKSNIIGRYRGSLLGFSWSVLNPLLLLLVYTFTFSYVFKAKWPSIDIDSHAEYAMILFSGMIVHGLLAEVIAVSPQFILSNVSYVKKIVFPLEIIPAIIIGPALYQALINTVILLGGLFLVHGSLPLTLFWLPVVLFPFVVFLMGISSLLAGLGVYIRDIQQMTGLAITILLFLSPVFYSLSMLPPKLQTLVMFNPLTIIIEEARKIIILGQAPNGSHLFVYLFASLCFTMCSLKFFSMAKKGFADVL